MTTMPGRMQSSRPTKVITPMISEAMMTWPQLIPLNAVPRSSWLAAGQRRATP